MPTTDTIATKDKGRWQGWHAFRRGLATKSSRARNPGPHHPGHPAALLSAGDAAGLHQEDPRALRSRHAEVRGKAGLASDSVDVWAGEVWPGPAFGRAFFLFADLTHLLNACDRGFSPSTQFFLVCRQTGTTHSETARPTVTHLTPSGFIGERASQPLLTAGR